MKEKTWLIPLLASAVVLGPVAGVEYSCTVHHEVYPTPCTTQHHRCPDFTDKNGDGVCDHCVELKGQAQGAASNAASGAKGGGQHRFSALWPVAVAAGLALLGVTVGRRG